jgi:gamma-glutamyltranspeptidase/glutathione hydrolase
MPISTVGGRPTALYLRDGRAYRWAPVSASYDTSRMVAAEKGRVAPAAGGRAARRVLGDLPRIAEFHHANEGPLVAADLADFSVKIAPALRTRFGALEVAACGFWCQGPVLLEILNMLDGIDLAKLGHNSPAYLHRLVETIKLAFADRDAYYGDPARAGAGRAPSRGPRGGAPRAGRRAGVEGDAAGRGRAPRRELLPVAGSSDALDTSDVAVIDADGNGFSATPSDPNVDSPVVAGVGCVISPRGSQGWLDPAHASVVAPGKRPRLTPAPAMALQDGALLMPFGTPGGDVQQQAMLQVLLNVTVFGMPLQEAIEAPRVALALVP